MKIKKVELKNFKFHKDLDFEIKKQNCLIYGENGTGKSSIYEALYSVFKTYFRNNSFDFNKFKTNNSSDELGVKVILDEDELIIPNEDYTLPLNINKENKKTIYFANQDLLESLIGDETNFYLVIENHLSKYFEKLNKLYQEQEDKKNLIEFTKLELFLKEISTETNKIIELSFEEEFIISFQTTFYEYDFIKDEYIKPFIKLQIDEKNKLKLNFNEAKLKLTSIAIFFALIKLEEGENNTNPLKLLVLDDFLTSLDMANRHYIIEYILSDNGFKDYQKIILTHNLQFYNLIVKLLNRRAENGDWDTKHIFLIQDNNQEISIVSPRSHDYIKDAKSELTRGQYRKSGNALRKEFERINNEFKELLELGKSEKLQGIIDTLKSDAIIFAEKPHKLLNEINPYIYNFKGILNSDNIEIEKKIKKLKELIEKIIQPIEDNKCDLSEVKELLNKTEFYRDILFNPASHNNEEIEIYRKECINSIKLLEDLNKILNNLQGK